MPFGIESLAADLAKVLRSLPLVADRLQAIAESTSELPNMRAGIDAVTEDTERLGGVETALSRLADGMAQMRQELARGAGSDRRVARQWTAGWPTSRSRCRSWSRSSSTGRSCPR